MTINLTDAQRKEIVSMETIILEQCGISIGTDLKSELAVPNKKLELEHWHFLNKKKELTMKKLLLVPAVITAIFFTLVMADAKASVTFNFTSGDGVFDGNTVSWNLDATVQNHYFNSVFNGLLTLDVEQTANGYLAGNLDFLFSNPTNTSINIVDTYNFGGMFSNIVNDNPFTTYSESRFAGNVHTLFAGQSLILDLVTNLDYFTHNRDHFFDHAADQIATASVPEPSTMLLMGLGLLGLVRTKMISDNH